jgi:hypothetical protein
MATLMTRIGKLWFSIARGMAFVLWLGCEHPSAPNAL